MIGGGRGAFIGGVHRLVAAMDGEAELVAGAFSSDPERSRASGADLGLDPQRVYADFAAMAEAESAAPPDQRLDFVVIVTPNDQHYPAAEVFLKLGFNVVCDKPLCMTLVEARRLEALVKQTKLVFALTHNYTGYPMVKLARDLVRTGHLGNLRKIVVEYPQGWLSTPLERTGQKQAAWRHDPKRSGMAGCLGDVGTHAENLARYITGLHIQELCADLTSFGPGRALDDDANILVRWEQGVKGLLHSSQISAGELNALAIRVYGTKAGLEWHQQRPDQLITKYLDQPTQIWDRGTGYLPPKIAAVCRLPAGHPEGYLEAFANLYREAFRAIRAQVAGKPVPKDTDFPTLADGVAGMAFLTAAVTSGRAGGKWRRVPR